MDTTNRPNRTRSRTLAVAGLAALIGGIIGPGATTATIDTGPRAVFVPITPCRLIDTRPGDDNVGTRTTPLGSGETATVQVTGTNGNCTIPTDATAVAANVVAVNPTHAGFFTLWPSGVTPRPLTANLNFTAGAPPTPNKIDVKLSTNGRLDIYNFTGTAHLVLDIFGYYADHTHDDRYVKAEQVLMVPAHARQPFGAFQQIVVGCVARDPGDTTSGGTGWVPLSVPVGARIVSATVTMRDASGATPYDVRLQRHSMVYGTGLGDALATFDLATATGGSGNDVAVEHTLVPSVQTLVTEDTWFTLLIDVGEHPSTNGFCGATVTIDHAG